MRNQKSLEDGYDAVVVGSGYGGSVAAYRMSVAGINVCLLEKGNRWRSEDFPTNSVKLFSNARLENVNLGIKVGHENALFQVHQQNDSIAVVACGLGGGSLVNAGVMLSTPVRVRRHPKWPKEWEREWDQCEASAAAMLKAQSPPVKFPITRIIDDIIEGESEEYFEDPVKLAVNFDIEDSQSSLVNHQKMDRCLACGNCIAGCLYNAKNSTDKTYLHLAIQAGCTVRTECRVRFVIENPYVNVQQNKNSSRRRWRVYLNETDYIATDFVILSAGVFGTSEILFRSQTRGLELSECLGAGFSCNGNNVGYVTGSPAPLNGYGLDRKDLPNIPFEKRPGPSITTSYSSSLGFTIQGAVVPTAYPYLVFKGISNYGWPNWHWFFHGVIEKLKRMIGCASTNGMALNAMGYDEGNGRIAYEKDKDKILFDPPHDPLLPQKIRAFQKLTKKLGGVLFMSRFRSTAVHLLGGCNASTDSLSGVCNHKGQVFDTKQPATVHPGLYVCDASLIPCVVGINPCLTIASAAEHVSRHLVEDTLLFKAKIILNRDNVSSDHHPVSLNEENFDNKDSTVLIKETMRGHVGGMPCSAHLRIKLSYRYQKGQTDPLLKGKVGGFVTLKAIEKDKMHIIDGYVDMCMVDNRTPYTQYMHYHILLATSSGSRYILEGKKTMNPYLFGLYAWKETRTLRVSLKKAIADTSRDATIDSRGELKLSWMELLKSSLTLEGKGKGRFVQILLQALIRTYIRQIPRQNPNLFDAASAPLKAYPISTTHRIKTEDGYFISCEQWKCTSEIPRRQKGDHQSNPVLLINGYSTESYCLPTEPRDLVRTLLEEGHETWLLQPRLHPSNPANVFTIEDIGKYDIPAAIKKILELQGTITKIHVVAHCIGGLAIHIALMGGHVTTTNIASLSCTNSSMFFKLTTSATVKMWLPLAPLALAILGKDKILPLLENSKAGTRQQLLKRIVSYIPRYERCTCKECEVFSGIFGNTFWHENISSTMHLWLNKQSTSCLPMAAFPHLRNICNSGFIVDSNGENSYLIHPERMALPTLYISGGRSLLVTQETSFLAHNYMKLHQPGFRHERVIVENFGHSDLLIGEKSYEKVFPHILSHIRACEEDDKGGIKSERTKYGNNNTKVALNWGSDHLCEDHTGIGCWFSPFVVMLLLLMLVLPPVSFFQRFV